MSVYLLLLLTIGILDFKKVRNFNDYVLAGRKQSFIIVTVSLMASMIGSGRDYPDPRNPLSNYFNNRYMPFNDFKYN